MFVKIKTGKIDTIIKVYYARILNSLFHLNHTLRVSY